MQMRVGKLYDMLETSVEWKSTSVANSGKTKVVVGVRFNENQ